jgi:hypothetical protein
MSITTYVKLERSITREELLSILGLEEINIKGGNSFSFKDFIVKFWGPSAKKENCEGADELILDHFWLYDHEERKEVIDKKFSPLIQKINHKVRVISQKDDKV